MTAHTHRKSGTAAPTPAVPRIPSWIAAMTARITAWVGPAAIAGMGLTMTVVVPLGLLG